MPGAYSRSTFDPTKHYSQVRMQQGRVQLDSDWNEQAAINVRERRAALADLIGASGVLKGSEAFRIEPLPGAAAPLDLSIVAGRCYVNGVAAVAEASPVSAVLVAGRTDQLRPEAMAADGQTFAPGQWLEVSNGAFARLTRITAATDGVLTVTEAVDDLAGALTVTRVPSYLTQPEQPAPGFRAASGNLALPDGRYLAYLDVWTREVTALDDPRLLEPALGGADTTARMKTVWQVGLVDAGPDATCDTPLPESVTTAPSGRLNARTRPPEAPTDACQLPPTAGYRRLANQLYRVEVHQGGDRAAATFKWSRDNGIVATRIETIDGRVLTVADIGRDEALGFAPGQWVEIVSDITALTDTRHPLFEVESVDPSRRLVTLRAPADAFATEPGLQLRRWDQAGASAADGGVVLAADWIVLESGIEVLFSDGSYRTGDYWLIPARTATGEIDWPPFQVPNTDPVPQPPLGVRHDICRLALLEVANGQIGVTDCRNVFPPLTAICAEDVCFDNAACQLPEAETMQQALDALCARPTGGNPIITGVVVFDLRDSDNNEFFSDNIDPRLGPGPLQVVLGMELGRGETIFSGAFESFDQLNYPQVLVGAEIDPRRGGFRVGVRVLSRETPITQVRVRWWASLPARDLGEVVVSPTPAPTIGPTISPTIGPTIRPTISPTIRPTISPTITPTIRPTVGPIFSPTAIPLSPLSPLSPVRSPRTRSGRGRPLTDVRGVGDAFSARLRAAGIRDAAALANADVAKVAEILAVSPVRARALIEAARSLK
jgi:Family of unknown function (DUF6519)/Helix-hairpin-helix domain